MVYRERLYPAWWLVVALFLFVPTSVLIFLPLSIPVGVSTGLVLWLGSVALLWLTSPLLSLSDSEFWAGRSALPLRVVSDIQVIDRESARAEKGVNLDARAWLVMRPWITPAVKIILDDPNDPTPYWLVSTREPERIVAAWMSLPKT